MAALHYSALLHFFLTHLWFIQHGKISITNKINYFKKFPKNILSCFHHRCNIYIALNSLFTLPLHFGMSVKYIILQFGIYFISLRSCYYIQVIPLLTTTLATQIEFYIGVDRLLCSAFPLW